MGQENEEAPPNSTTATAPENGQQHVESNEDQEQDQDQLMTEFMSDEKLPENWNEEFPGITRFAPSEPATSLQFDSGDINLVNSLGNLAPGALIDEIKAMHAIACRLAIDEEQEKTRGKILRVLLD